MIIRLVKYQSTSPHRGAQPDEKNLYIYQINEFKVRRRSDGRFDAGTQANIDCWLDDLADGVVIKAICVEK